MPLTDLHRYGQSPWLDYIRRHLLTGGGLARLVRDDGIRGVTSNPSIFEKAIAGSGDYDDALRALESARDRGAAELYEELALADIRGAADVLRSVYDAADGADGFASLEVSPHLAHDTAGTIDEARRLWKRLDRPNVMIKVPATAEGMPAIKQLIGDGINVNVTLMFSRAAYAQVAEAWLAGLEALRAAGGNVHRVASVASLFVSRVDVMIDPMLDAAVNAAAADRRASIEALRGKAGIANAKRIYQAFREVCDGARFGALAAHGARPQRILFASTSTKDPRQRDVMYVEALIGPDTVDTIPPATLDAFRAHGTARASLTEGMAEAERTLADLAAAGISLDDVTDRLLDEGVKKFAESYDTLLTTIEARRRKQLGALLDRFAVTAPEPIAAEVTATLGEWDAGDKVRRLWARDASLWTNGDEARWLDWLRVADLELSDVDALMAFAGEVRAAGVTHVAVLGMGGSSLCPDGLSQVFPPPAGAPRLTVLDSTDPAQVRTFEAGLDLARTLFIVSSKSGSTLEPNLFNDYFFHRLSEKVGAAKAAARFVAVTDPGSALEKLAKARGYGRIFAGIPGIGGRYSALSPFGLVPAAAAQLDVRALLGSTVRMVHACAACVPAAQNPGVGLGALLGVAARHGRNKVTFIASPPVRSLGAWLEQLLAESTGKQGKGLIPVDGEPVGAPAAYGADRVFAYLRVDGAADPAQDAAADALARAGHPVVRLQIGDATDLGQEFFRWEIATAVAGSVLQLHPFDQPDVEASKVQARKLTDAYEQTGHLPPQDAFFEDGPVALFADDANRDAIRAAVGGDRTLRAHLKAHLARAGAGDYVGLLAWLERSAAHDAPLQAMRAAIRDHARVATVVGFGPRFLHSTGQAYKGGPNSGVFLHIVGDDPVDVPVPDKRYTFGIVKQAQAQGDFLVLSERKRRVLGVRLTGDPATGLAVLVRAVRDALA